MAEILPLGRKPPINQYTENYATLIYYGKNCGTMEKSMVL